MKHYSEELERLAKQADRQQKHRERLKSERKPNRDDIAPVMTHYLITKSYRQNAMNSFERSIVAPVIKHLEEQGFDKAACHKAFYDLIEKYTKSNWKFRQKSHLDKSPSGDQN